MKILILGSSGNIGSHLYKKFLNQNIFTIGVSRKECDLLNIVQLRKFIKSHPKFDILIFLVGLAHAKGKNKDINDFDNINYKTLDNLISIIKSEKKVPQKIIFASTISVYGERYKQIKYDEDLDCKPFSPYAITKLKAENFLLNEFQEKSWILRFAPVYADNFLLNIIRRTRLGKFFYKVGDGNRKFSLCNINNIIIVIESIIEGKVPVGVYNISDNIEYSYRYLLMKQKAKLILTIPKIVILSLYYFGILIKNTFLIENTVKLVSDNIFSSSKIRTYIDLPQTLNDYSFNNDD